MAALNHPNVCTLYDIGPNYLVMELIEGDSLATRLVRGRLERHLVVRYGVQIADALAAAHAKCIVHRDLKPENVLIAGDHVEDRRLRARGHSRGGGRAGGRRPGSLERHATGDGTRDARLYVA